MAFTWFDTSEVDAFVDTTVRSLAAKLPPARLDEGAAASTKSTARLEKAHDDLLRDVQGFARGRRLNVYKKGRLASRLKWALHDAGYPVDFVEALAFKVAAVVASAGADRLV